MKNFASCFNDEQVTVNSSGKIDDSSSPLSTSTTLCEAIPLLHEVCDLQLANMHHSQHRVDCTAKCSRTIRESLSSKNAPLSV